MAGGWMNDDRQHMRLILAARLSSKTGIGIETQDQYGREWAERLGHTIVATVADVKSGKVAPWDRPSLKPWVTDPAKMAQYDGILAYRNDRLSRGDWNDETRIRQWASDNGKVLVIVDGPQWPPRDDGDFWSWTAQAKQANAEWEEIRERARRARRALIESGKLVGQVPTWAFTIDGDEYDKRAVPTKAGEKYVPLIFQRVADGESLAAVAVWARAEGIGSGRISASTIKKIVNNRIYMGDRFFMFEGARTTLKVEPLVDAHLWDRANRRLANAPQGRRGPVSGNPALLTGCLFCPRCVQVPAVHAPMYRITTGRRPYKRDYYRCAGHYPERKSCGNMVDLAALDKLVVEKISTSSEPHKELRLEPGENHDIELTEIKLALADLPNRGLDDAEEDAERARLRARRDELLELPSKPDQWGEVLTGQTEGDYFVGLDTAERRKYLVKRYRILAAKNDYGEPYAILDIEGAYGLRTLDVAGRLPRRRK